ncbi:hypothetical protein [Mesorhizobium sp. M1136]|uniref:hypothetical protein n=1 Tax=Mesorhizobium sp. M1136 TaxID=2957059 RepID=UPI00333CE9F5
MSHKRRLSHAEIVADGGEHGVDSNAVAATQKVPAQIAIVSILPALHKNVANALR